MWLIDVSTHKLHEFQGAKLPKYTILSHTWGDEEVTFRDLEEHADEAKLKAGYDKIVRTCRRTRQDGYRWTWIDTCCIDKRSSAELSEAINSMFQWYVNAEMCYVYLADVLDTGEVDTGEHVDFSFSRWFRRGWTLQELIAPKHILFFSSSWMVLGTKRALERDTGFLTRLSRITGIEVRLLQDPGHLRNYSIAQRMSWMAKRDTTRKEDLAYCLMGLFNVHMPILYGEGILKAFTRLQLEIIRTTPDETIFAWRRGSSNHPFDDECGLLARLPSDFGESASIVRHTLPRLDALRNYSMTNIGLSMEAYLLTPPTEGTDNAVDSQDDYLVLPIGARLLDGTQTQGSSIGLIMVRVHQHQMTTRKTYQRVAYDRFYLVPDGQLTLPTKRPEAIYVPEEGQYIMLM